MNKSFTQDAFIGKFFSHILKFFPKLSKPVQLHLGILVLSMIALNCCHSIKFAFENFMSFIASFSLNSYYYALTNKLFIKNSIKTIIEYALQIHCSDNKNYAIIISVDDTMIEKKGSHFDNWRKLFDHALHTGSSYIWGHCFVSSTITVRDSSSSPSKYISFPVQYRMWTGEKSKLKIAAEMIETIMSHLPDNMQVILCFDSWYAKSEMLELITRYPNLHIICNVRIDTVCYALPPQKNGKRGRPKTHGDKLSPADFHFSKIGDYLFGYRAVLTKIFGSRPVYAFVTKRNESYRLFLSTGNPQSLLFDKSCLSSHETRQMLETDATLFPLVIYKYRWEIEITYYEQKTFWGLRDYQVRSQKKIESLLNLQTVAYSLMTILPRIDTSFSYLAELSPQQARSRLSSLIMGRIYLWQFAEKLKLTENNTRIIKCITNRLLQMPLVA